MRRARGYSCILVFVAIVFIIFTIKLFANKFLINHSVKVETTSVILNSLITMDAVQMQTQRYITPSLADLGIRGLLPTINDHVLMLTRVPGTGAELLVLILQRLQGFNAFKHIRLPPGDSGLLTTLQQVVLLSQLVGVIF